MTAQAGSGVLVRVTGNMVKTELIYLLFCLPICSTSPCSWLTRGPAEILGKKSLPPESRVTQLVICQILLLSTETLPASGFSNPLLV